MLRYVRVVILSRGGMASGWAVKKVLNCLLIKIHLIFSAFSVTGNVPLVLRARAEVIKAGS